MSGQPPFASWLTRKNIFFAAFVCFFVALMTVVEIKNGRFWTNDFRVYYDAAKTFVNGNSPYGQAFGLSSGYFKYTPTTLYFFAPLSVFPYFVGQLLHVIILTCCTIGSILMLNKMFASIQVNSDNRFMKGFSYYCFVLIAVHLVREWHLGNINVMLLFLFLFGYTNLDKRDILTGITWAIMILLKPIVLLVVLPLIFYRKWKALLSLSLAVITLILLPFIFEGPTAGILLWKEWMKALALHGDFVYENSISYLANKYVGYQSKYGGSLLVGASFAIGMLYAFRKKWEVPAVKHFVFFMPLAFAPNFFNTDTEHFLMSLPFIALLIFSTIETYRQKWLWLFLPAFIGYSLQSSDLWGKNISAWMSEFGILGLSNLYFIGLGIWVMHSCYSNNESTISS